MSRAGVRVKICGLRRPEDITAANRCRPDYIGFVFAPSRRRVTPEAARLLRRALDPAIRSVGVFVNEQDQVIARLCEENTIDLIQLHGDESDEDIARIKALTGKPVIKALRVEAALPPLPRYADYLLFDTWSPNDRGGTGEPFHWPVLRPVTHPYFLAGGLHSGNVARVLEQVSPFCLDVSSGVESGGWKDPQKMQQFMDAVRRYQQAMDA